MINWLIKKFKKEKSILIPFWDNKANLPELVSLMEIEKKYKEFRPLKDFYEI